MKPSKLNQYSNVITNIKLAKKLDHEQPLLFMMLIVLNEAELNINPETQNFLLFCFLFVFNLISLFCACWHVGVTFFETKDFVFDCFSWWFAADKQNHHKN